MVLGLIVDYDLETAPKCDILIIPGGPGVRDLLENESLLSWLRDVYDSITWLGSVCTGSLLLGAAGLLRGKKATTHWNAINDLEKYGAIPVSKRVVREGKIVMAAGVSAGIDMALSLASMIKGEEIARAIQLKIEYDPSPPFDGGSPSKETTEVIALVQKGLK